MRKSLVHRLLLLYSGWLKFAGPTRSIPAVVERVCIFSMSGDGLRAGDRIATATILNLVARRFPDATVCLITTPYQAERYGDLYLRHLGIDRLITGEIHGDDDWRNWLALWRRLRKERFDVCVQDSRDEVLTPFFALLCGIGVRIGLQRGFPTDRFLNPDRNIRAQSLGDATLLDIAESYAQALGFDPPLPREQIKPFFRLAPPVQPLDVATQRPIVVLHPGGARDWNRRWPHTHYAELCEQLVGGCNPQVLIIGGADEGDEADLIVRLVRQRCPAANISNRCGGDLNRIAGYLAAADLLVANDSSVMHIAAGLGTPAVILFGPSYHGVWDAYRQQTSLRSGFACWRHRPTLGHDTTVNCGYQCPVAYDPSTKRYPRCLTQLQVANVFVECKRKLGADEQR